MSHSHVSHYPSTASLANVPPRHRRTSFSAENPLEHHIDARSDDSKAVRSQPPLLTSHRRKVLGAAGAITLLAMATVLPQVSSQAIADSTCEQVVKSGAEISRGQISSLLVMPERSTREAVRQAIADPYCILPPTTLEDSTEVNAGSSVETVQPSSQPKTVEREAYPLAFDPETWIVLNYSEGEYQGYDFVFKP